MMTDDEQWQYSPPYSLYSVYTGVIAPTARWNEAIYIRRRHSNRVFQPTHISLGKKKIIKKCSNFSYSFLSRYSCWCKSNVRVAMKNYWFRKDKVQIIIGLPIVCLDIFTSGKTVMFHHFQVDCNQIHPILLKCNYWFDCFFCRAFDHVISGTSEL